MQNNDTKFFNALNQIEKIGPIRFKRIYSHFESIEQAWNASLFELIEAGVEKEIAEIIIEQRKSIDPDKEFEKIEKENVKIITIKDKEYPKLLKEIYNPSALLYIKGNFVPEDEFSISIVGTRKISSYGKQVTPQIVQDLVEHNITIVSGMAVGIDSLAHRACLESGGRTIAVLGSGIDEKSIYPASNRLLAKEIQQSGAMISELPLGSQPLKQHFPARNRIIAGLSLGTLVVEANETSGALITSKYALEQNREVFAIPGNIYAQNSKGPNNLIKMGAKLVTSAQDVLEELNLSKAEEFIETKKIIPDTKEEAKILEHLTKEPMHIDLLVRKTGLDAAIVNSTLAMMEMKGKVRNLGSMNYVVAR